MKDAFPFPKLALNSLSAACLIIDLKDISPCRDPSGVWGSFLLSVAGSSGRFESNILDIQNELSEV